MKELKALEILKYQRDGFVRFGRDTKEWDEAIAELEALQGSKACNDCSHYDKRGGLKFCNYGWQCKYGAPDMFQLKAKK